MKDPENYEARAEIMWCGSLSHNGLTGCGNDGGDFASHVLEHELGHGFGMTDFYGGEGELDGFPPGGFPGGSSLMMAGSSMQITDFDGWMLRYFWDKIHLEEGRFSY